MSRVASRLCSLGMVLRSGAAEGADTAFERGVPCDDAKQIFLPWRGFRGHASALHEVCPRALEFGRSFHPVFDTLSQGQQKLMARNAYQVLGPSLDDPVAFVVCWTPDGCENEAQRTSKTGGTGQAIAIASRHGIPVFNLAREDAMLRLRARLQHLGLVAVPAAGNPAEPTRGHTLSSASGHASHRRMTGYAMDA